MRTTNEIKKALTGKTLKTTTIDNSGLDANFYDKIDKVVKHKDKIIILSMNDIYRNGVKISEKLQHTLTLSIKNASILSRGRQVNEKDVTSNNVYNYIYKLV